MYSVIVRAVVFHICAKIFSFEYSSSSFSYHHHHASRHTYLRRSAKAEEEESIRRAWWWFGNFFGFSHHLSFVWWRVGGTFFVCDEKAQKITKKKHRVFLSLLRTQVVATKETKRQQEHHTNGRRGQRPHFCIRSFWFLFARVCVFVCVCVCVLF
jgi:hypothetical protein